MIFDNLCCLDRYFPLVPSLELVQRQLEAGLEQSGRLRGEELFYFCQSLNPVPKGTRGYEVHQKYADLQILLEGRERIDIADPGTLVSRGEAGDDIRFFHGELNQSVFLRPGQFVLFFAGEPHEPCLEVEGFPSLKKVVFKIEKSVLKLF